MALAPFPLSLAGGSADSTDSIVVSSEIGLSPSTSEPSLTQAQTNAAKINQLLISNKSIAFTKPGDYYFAGSVSGGYASDASAIKLPATFRSLHIGLGVRLIRHSLYFSNTRNPDTQTSLGALIAFQDESLENEGVSISGGGTLARAHVSSGDNFHTCRFGFSRSVSIQDITFESDVNPPTIGTYASGKYGALFCGVDTTTVRNVTFKGSRRITKAAYYNAATTYRRNDETIYLGHHYRSIADSHIANSPPTSPTFWQDLGTDWYVNAHASDGLHFIGANRIINIDGWYGATGDDGIAIMTSDYRAPWSVISYEDFRMRFGDIESIIIRNVHPHFSWEVIRVGGSSRSYHATQYPEGISPSSMAVASASGLTNDYAYNPEISGNVGRRLTKTGAFTNFNWRPGSSIFLAGGTWTGGTVNPKTIKPGWYTIGGKVDNDTIWLETPLFACRLTAGIETNFTSEIVNSAMTGISTHLIAWQYPTGSPIAADTAYGGISFTQIHSLFIDGVAGSIAGDRGSSTTNGSFVPSNIGAHGIGILDDEWNIAGVPIRHASLRNIRLKITGGSCSLIYASASGLQTLGIEDATLAPDSTSSAVGLLIKNFNLPEPLRHVSLTRCTMDTKGPMALANISSNVGLLSFTDCEYQNWSPEGETPAFLNLVGYESANTLKLATIGNLSMQGCRVLGRGKWGGGTVINASIGRVVEGHVNSCLFESLNLLIKGFNTTSSNRSNLILSGCSFIEGNATLANADGSPFNSAMALSDFSADVEVRDYNRTSTTSNSLVSTHGTATVHIAKQTRVFLLTKADFSAISGGSAQVWVKSLARYKRFAQFPRGLVITGLRFQILEAFAPSSGTLVTLTADVGADNGGLTYPNNILSAFSCLAVNSETTTMVSPIVVPVGAYTADRELFVRLNTTGTLTAFTSAGKILLAIDFEAHRGV